MPSAKPIPTLDVYMTAAEQTLRGSRSSTADIHRGSSYELVHGPSAILWARQSARTKALFRACYTDTATGPDLERHVLKKYGVARIPAAYGLGTMVVTRPAPGSFGTLFEGTRAVVQVNGKSVPYVIAEDTDVAAADTLIAVPLRASRTGTGTRVSAGSGVTLETLFDPTLTVSGLTCGEGTDEEEPAVYLTRARQVRRDARVGYEASIESACRSAGADEVVVLEAGALGSSLDVGLTMVYVGDAGYSTSASLQKACTLALDSVHVAGCDEQIRGMALTPVTATVAVYLVSDPSEHDLVDLGRQVIAVLVDDFARRQRYWSFRADSLAGVVQRSSGAIQQAIVTTSPGDPPVSFPATLPKYVLFPGSITLSFAGPL